jgi:hypothetical protein
MGVQDWVFIGDIHMAHELFVKHGSATSGRQNHTFANKIYGEGERYVELEPKNIQKLKQVLEVLYSMSSEKTGRALEQQQ